MVVEEFSSQFEVKFPPELRYTFTDMFRLNFYVLVVVKTYHHRSIPNNYGCKIIKKT